MKHWLTLLLRCLLAVLGCAAGASARGAGQVTHTFDYDAVGSVIARTGTTPNRYLFTGQQFDPDVGLYYLRARYHNPDSGRFWTADAFEGFASDPASLHRYTYCQNNPVNCVDPSGYSASMAEGMSVLGLGPTVTSALLATSLGVLSRGAGAISGGAGFMDSVEAAITGAPTEAAINLVGGALGVGLLKGAGHLMQTYLPLLAPEATVALSRAFAAMGRSWGAVEASFAQLQTAVRAGAQDALVVAEANLTRAFSQAERLQRVISQLRGILGWGEAEALAARSGELLGPAGPGQFVLRSGQGSLESAGVLRTGGELNRVFDSRWQLGRPYSQPMGGSFSPGSTLPTSASQAIIDRGLNWPGVVNNAELGVTYRAGQNLPVTLRTSLGGTAPEVLVAPPYRGIRGISWLSWCELGMSYEEKRACEGLACLPERAADRGSHRCAPALASLRCATP